MFALAEGVAAIALVAVMTAAARAARRCGQARAGPADRHCRGHIPSDHWARYPHHRASSAELFYVLSGAIQLLADDRLLGAGEGDPAVVPPGLPHAFAAARGSDADLLIVITPGY